MLVRKTLSFRSPDVATSFRLSDYVTDLYKFHYHL